MRTLVWFRGKDLRISDHAPLVEAITQGEVIPLFVLDPFFFSVRKARELPHRMQYLLESLVALKNNLRSRGSDLVCVRGESQEVVPRLAAQWKVDQVFAYRWTEPFGRMRDRRVASTLDVPLELFEGETLLPPESVRTQANTPFAVYTPFARKARTLLPALAPRKAPKRVPEVPQEALALDEPVCELSDLELTYNPHLVAGGERAARERLERFLDEGLATYQSKRDRLAESGTSRLSADLKFATISVSEVYDRVTREEGGSAEFSDSKERFISQLLWREFAYAILWDHPRVVRQPFRQDFSDFPYREDANGYRAWEEGKTGYPVVDAAARQLLREGYVHNRARMISASFLTKHLLIDYRLGERHYLKYLTDGDWAVNNLGWQWSAGCGVDAQPYFRVFNPMTQGKRFDPDGEYVRRYLPELAGLETRHIHQPWEAPASALQKAGIVLGKDYPEPIVEHRFARERFLGLASKTLKKR